MKVFRERFVFRDRDGVIYFLHNGFLFGIGRGGGQAAGQGLEIQVGKFFSPIQVIDIPLLYQKYNNHFPLISRLFPTLKDGLQFAVCGFRFLIAALMRWLEPSEEQPDPGLPRAEKLRRGGPSGQGAEKIPARDSRHLRHDIGVIGQQTGLGGPLGGGQDGVDHPVLQGEILFQHDIDKARPLRNGLEDEV